MPTLSAPIAIPLELLQPAVPTILDYRQGDAGLAQIGTLPSDAQLYLDLDREQFIHMYPPLPYRQLDRTNTVVDGLYGEAGTPVFISPVQMPVLVMLEPPKKLLRRWGVENVQDGIALLSEGWMANHAPSGFRVTPGDRIDYFDGGSTFSLELVTVKFVDYFGNTQIPLHRVCTLKNLAAS